MKGEANDGTNVFSRKCRQIRILASSEILIFRENTVNINICEKQNQTYCTVRRNPKRIELGKQRKRLMNESSQTTTKVAS